MADGASIVNVGSAAGAMAHYGIAYGASKWALRGITRTAAMELGPRGIRVNLVSPGFIETPMTASAPGAFREVNLASTPLGRTGLAAEVAAVIVHLLSSDASFVTGTEVAVDGGLTGHGGGLAIARAIDDGDASGRGHQGGGKNITMGDSTTTTAASQRYALGALIATSVSALVVNANTSAVSILIPAISEDTGTSTTRCSGRSPATRSWGRR